MASQRTTQVRSSWQVAERRYPSEESMAQPTPPAPAITSTNSKPEVIDTDMIRTP